MNILKRALISVKRRPGKSLVFLLLVTILGAMTAGAVIIQQAISTTDANLRQRMPAVMMVQAVHDDFENEPPVLSPEMIRMVADLPYVAFFDYAIDVGHWSVTAREINPWYAQGVDWPIMIRGYDEELGTFLHPRGVSSADFIEARDGLLELVSGRTFTDDELVSRPEITPVIISAELAQINDLWVGSTFMSRMLILDEFGEDENEVLVDQAFPMEVIGLIAPSLPPIPDDIDTGFPILNQNARAHHRVYLPNNVAEEMMNLRIASEEWWEDDAQPIVQHFFTLRDPADHQNFVRAIAQLDGDWEAVDLSTGFAVMASSMMNLSELADFILIGSVVATVLVVSLLVLLFLRERTYEIGIYLAMGDKKRNIVQQIILELIPLALIGLTFALLIGNIVASNLSQELVRQDLIANPPTQESVQTGGQLEILGYRFSMTEDELLASYEINVNPTVVGVFYGAGLLTVTVATIVPISLAVNINPKKLLT